MAGKPTGLAIGRDGNVLVADTHYYRVLVYSPEGKLLRDSGREEGREAGRVRLCDQRDPGSRGQLLRFRIRRLRPHSEVFTPQGRFIRQWGGHGSEPGQFNRPQSAGFRRRRAPLGGRRLQSSHPGLRPPGKTAALLGQAGQHRANCIILTAWRWDRRIRFTFANSATSGCRNSPATAVGWAAGDRGDAIRANSSIPGDWSATAAGRFTCWIRAITGYNRSAWSEGTVGYHLAFNRRATCCCWR